jgi:hypothetical protein
MEHFFRIFSNHTLNIVFSWSFNQPITTVHSETKVLTLSAQQEIVANRPYFGDFDPFGDFALIFGASKLNLKFLEIPVRYGSRRYGTTQISRFRHGLLLLKMAVMAYRKLKAV